MKTMSLACNFVKFSRGTSWMGRGISSKLSALCLDGRYEVDGGGFDASNAAVYARIPPIHPDCLGRAVGRKTAADFYQSIWLVVADNRVQHLRFYVA